MEVSLHTGSIRNSVDFRIIRPKGTELDFYERLVKQRAEILFPSGVVNSLRQSCQWSVMCYYCIGEKGAALIS